MKFSIWIKKIIELTFIPFGDDVTIYTDSMYVVGTMMLKWNRKYNQDL